MISVQSIGDKYIVPNRKEFLIEYEADVADLPTSTTAGATPNAPGYADPGSIAYSADLSLFYMLGPDGVWHTMG